MEVDLRNLSVAQQIIVLKNLRQGAAAWLMGLSPRSMRNHREIPRRENGRYDSRKLLFCRATAASRKHQDKIIEKDLKLASALRAASAS